MSIVYDSFDPTLSFFLIDAVFKAVLTLWEREVGTDFVEALMLFVSLILKLAFYRGHNLPGKRGLS